MRLSFLQFVDAGEKLIARVLSVITGIVIIAALVQLSVVVGQVLLDTSNANWLGDDLLKVLGDLLTVLIALEVMQNITSYLRKHVVQVELVLVTALTAVARKVIVLPPGSENKPQLLAGLGLAALCLAGAYWLVKRSVFKGAIHTAMQTESRRVQARGSLAEDRSVQHDGGDGPQDGADRQH
ncbi:MAG: phosphate-starvation-inducible PsiE family protein [Prochlorococcus sp.]|nr:phosphate-starvation-inducible PsiE family protein [Prochlorococcaceae cyanobacterium Fu_MAG_50]